ncbi:MAG TPA: PAS domain S-box protein [Armatimonadota bacterium]|nr:PAS domain S-box protein [Armatimonadota bacterium]
MDETFAWAESMDAQVTVTDSEGIILYLNKRALAGYARSGGAALIGKNVLDCHSEKSRPLLERLYARHEAYHYVNVSRGKRKLLHVLPWYRDGEFAGLVEIGVPLPDDFRIEE